MITIKESALRTEVLKKLNKNIARLRKEFKTGNLYAWDCMQELKKQREVVYRIPTILALHDYAIENFLINRN